MKVEISFSEIPKDDDRSECEATDDDSYGEVHQIREKIEGLLITRLELRRVKAHGRSAVAMSAARDNLQQSLETLGNVMGETARLEYDLEGADFLPWPESRGEPGLQVKF